MIRLRRAASALLFLSLAARPAFAQAQTPVERARALVARMTLEEKFWQLFMIPGDFRDSTHDYSHGVFGLQVRTTGNSRSLAEPVLRSASDVGLGMPSVAKAHAEYINSMQKYFVERTRLGIPMLPFEEAVHGFGWEGSTMFPAAIALAATWDTALVGQVATAIGRETRSRGVRQILSPVVNIATDVRWGRVEETYGEDPYLSSRMAVAFVGALERNGIVATPKHFVANVGDGGRDSYPIDISRRLLDELHFPPFRAAIVEAGARSIMTSYNSVDGDPATQSRALLTDKLKHEWGFGGFAISDQSATGGSTVLHHTEQSTATATVDALNAGLDVIFQSSYEQYRPYYDAFRRGLIAESVIDSAVVRVLRAKYELGLFENPYVNPDSADYWTGNPENRKLAREAARASIVLLRNERRRLPLSGTVKSIAVIGADASEARLGGYSGPGIKPVSILDGIRERAGRATAVRYARGPGRITREWVVVPAERLKVKGEYFDNNRLDGAPRVTRDDARIDFGWTLNSPARGIPFDWYSVRWTGTITAPAGGAKRLGVEGNDGYRLYVDDRLVIDNWKKQSFGTKLADVNLRGGSTHAIRLEFFESTGNARIKLVWDAGITSTWRREIDSAVAVARASDIAVVVAGIEEGEFRDRAFLKLPGHQEELIQRVAATGKPVVVLLVGGSAITMSSWLDRVDAVLDVWYPGEEGGRAVADVLFGDANPSGRLPITFPISEGQLPLVYNHKPTGRGDDYLDLTGQPLFPFGFGLSYTTFEYAGLAIEPATIAPAGSATVRLTVKNTGLRAGDEVVQLYVRDVLTSVARPLTELKGFARVHLDPGQQREVRFTLSPAELRMLDRDMHWVVEPGAFRVMVGASSKDIRLRGELTVK
jgi:beta-glucosidase